MPTFSTANSSGTYTVPSDVNEIIVIVRGGVGGVGGDSATGGVGGPGGAGGEIVGVVDVAAGETYTWYVGENGGDGSTSSAGAGGSSPHSGGVSGGLGGTPEDTTGQGYGAGGAGPSAFVRDADGALLADAEGGGGGGGGSEGFAAGGGGGGAEGGNAGNTPGGSGIEGSPGDGTGSGGAGGGGGDNGADGFAGGDGGTAVHGDLQSVTTGTSTAGPSIEIVESPATPSALSATAAGPTQIDLSLTDNANDEDGLYLYRAQSSGSTVADYTQVADLSADTTTYSDTGLDDGSEYFYRVSAYKTGPEIESNLSNEDSATTTVPAPSGLTTGDGPSPATEADLSWTDNATDETGYEVQFSTDGGSSWTTATASLSPDTTSYTHTGLRNGEEYTYRVRAIGEDANSDWSGTATHTTTLPDATGLSLDNSVEDEITAEIDDSTNYGDVRFQIRETGESSWTASAEGFAEQTLASDGDTSGTLSTVFGTLQDGEEYEVRARTETEHVTGAWTTPTAKITVLPAPDALQVTDRFGTITFTYSDNSDNETTVELQRSTDGGSTWSTVDTYSPDTTTVEDTNPVLYQAVDYRVRQSTDDASGTTDTVTTTAAAATDGVWAEIHKPDAPQEDSRLQGAIEPDDVAALRIELEHTAISGWSLSLSPANPAIRDYHLGELAIFYGDVQLIRGPLQRTPQRGETISAKGEGQGHALRTDTTEASFSNVRVHKAIENYVSTIGVADSWNVRDPAVSELESNKTIADTSVGEDFDQLFGPFAADAPVVYDAGNDTLSLAQALWLQEAEDAPSIVDGTVTSDSVFSDGEAVQFNDENQWLNYEFTPGYDIPSSNVGWGVFLRYNNFEGDVVLDVGGVEVWRETINTDGGPLWRTDIFNVDDPPDLSAGTTYTVRVEAEANSTSVNFAGSLDVDLVCVYDQGDRHGGFTYNFPDTTDSNDALDGPELYPDEFTVRYDAGTETFHVHEMVASSTWGDTSNNQAIGLSTTGNSGDFVRASNSDNLTADFDAADVYGVSPVVELTLSRYSSGGTTTPLQGDAGQTVSELSVDVSTDDLPIIGSEGVELDAGGNWLENAQTLHGKGGYGFTVDHSASGLEVESYRRGDDNALATDDWTTDGEDAVSREPDSSDYYNEVRAFGADGSGLTPAIVRWPDQAERDRAGVIERRPIQTDAETRDELIAAAREALLEGIAGDQESGRIAIVPTLVEPGYSYGPGDFDGDRANLERVTISLDANGVSGTLQFGARRDVVATIQERTT